MLKGYACTYIRNMFMNCDMEKVVSFLLQRFKKILPVYFALNGFPFKVFLSFPFVSYDCLSATRLNSMLVLYKVRKWWTSILF